MAFRKAEFMSVKVVRYAFLLLLLVNVATEMKNKQLLHYTIHARFCTILHDHASHEMNFLIHFTEMNIYDFSEHIN